MTPRASAAGRAAEPRATPKKPKKSARSAKPRRKADESKAEPGEISATDMARRLAITAQGLGMWTKRPGAPVRIVGRRVWVRDGEFQRWREQELARQAVDEATRAMRQQLEAIQGGDPMVRKMRADARKAEIEVELLERSAVHVEEAVEIISKTLTDLRSVMVPFPRVAAPKLLGCKTVIELEQALHREVVRMMELLAAPDLGGTRDTDTEAAA